MRKRLVLVGLGVLGLAVVGGGTIWWDDIKTAFSAPATIVLRERAAARLRALDVADRTLAQAPVPAGWDAAIFVGTDKLGNILDQIVGTRLERHGGALDGAKVELTRISLKPAPGALEAEIAAVATQAQVSLGLRIAATVSIVGFDRKGPGDSARAILRLEPTEIAPSANIGPFAIGVRGAWARFAPDLAVLLAAPPLFEIPLPLPDTFPVSIGIDMEHKSDVGGTPQEPTGTVSWHLTLPRSDFVERVSYAAPVFTPTGLWLLARRDGAGQPAIAPADISGLSPEEIARRTATISAHIQAAIASISGQAADVRAYVSKNVFLAAAAQIAALPADKRTVTVRTTGQSGQLARTRWHDNVLGDGGAYAELNDPSKGEATIVLAPPAATWANGTLALTIGMQTRASAPIHVHVDPLVGGGAGTSIGIAGSGAGQATLTAKPVLLQEGDTRLATLDLRAACSTARVDVATDGKFSVGWGWTKVPAIGARMGIPIGNQPLVPMRVLDGTPILQRMPEERPPAPDRPPEWRVVAPLIGAVVAFAPREARGDDTGFHVGADLTFEGVRRGASAEETAANLQRAEAAVKARAEAIAKAVEEMLRKATVAPACTQKPELAILLGNLEFGGNNDIVKFFVAIGKLPQEFLKIADVLGVQITPAAVTNWLQNPQAALTTPALASIIIPPLPPLPIPVPPHLPIPLPMPTEHGGVSIPIPGGGSINIKPPW